MFGQDVYTFVPETEYEYMYIYICGFSRISKNKNVESEADISPKS